MQPLLMCVCVCYWPPPPDPQLGESWPFEQVHMLGLEQKPSPHEFLQIARGRRWREEWIRFSTEAVVIVSLGFKEGVTYGQCTGSLLAESSSPDSSMSGSESHTHWVWWREERNNKQTHLSARPPKHILVKALNKYLNLQVIFWNTQDLHSLCFQNKQNQLWY